MAQSLKNPYFNAIPTTLSEKEFNEFVFPHLSKQKRGPRPKISLYKTFCYILRILYTGMQWHALEIKRNTFGEKETSYTRVFRKFDQWANDGSFEKIFEGSVLKLAYAGLIDHSVSTW